jgi:hypothetical protein
MAQKVLSSIINTMRRHSRLLTTAVITTTYRLVAFIPLTLSVACCSFVRLRAAFNIESGDFVLTFDEKFVPHIPADKLLRDGPYQCCHLQQAQVGQ